MIKRKRSETAQIRTLALLLALAAGGATLSTAPGLHAQAPGTGFANAYSGNSSKPVDIEADSLEVDDKKKTAVFRGNVSATQGDMNLRSNEIHVAYTAGGSKTARAGASDASPLGGGGGQITQINANGNVFVTVGGQNVEKQTARSDRANFDVQSQIITLPRQCRADAGREPGECDRRQQAGDQHRGGERAISRMAAWTPRASPCG